MFFRSNHQSSIIRAGFTIIELLVVVAIMAIITATVLSSIPNFKSQSQLELLAHQLAVDIRQAQTYSRATITTVPGPTGSFPSYGIYLSTASNTFPLFSDLGGAGSPPAGPDGVFEAGVDHQEVAYSLDGAYEFQNICGYDAVGAHPLTDINILFQRPNLEGHFFLSAGEQFYSRLAVFLALRSQPDKRKRVDVYPNGQITVTPDWYSGTGC